MKCKLCDKQALKREEFCREHYIQEKEKEFLDLTTGGFFKWVEYFLKEYMPQDTPNMHREIVSLYFSLYNPYYVNRYNRQLEEIAYREAGKGQPLDCKVLTPNGWEEIGNLKVGDILYGSEGRPIKVTSLQPISEMDIYEVETRDGRKTRCDEDHLWTVKQSNNRWAKKTKVVTRPTKELEKIYKYPHYDKRVKKTYYDYPLFLEPSKPIVFSKKNLLIDPYVLGLWLGDGHSTGNRLTGEKKDLEFYRSEMDKIGYHYSDIKFKTENVGTMTISDIPVSKRNVKSICLSSNLRRMNLYNNKHIPKDYLFSSIEQRIALLQGLVDTDGYVASGKGQFDLTTISPKLKDGYIALVRSLGGSVYAREKTSNCNGKKCKSFLLSCKVPLEIIPARLPRKVSKWEGLKEPLASAIVSIKKIGKAKRRCISVSAKDGLYITEDFMLTHNSTVLNFFIPLYLLCNNGKTIKILAEVPKETEEGIVTEIKSVEVKLKERFGVIASKTASLAEDFILRMRNELSTNRRLGMFYGREIMDAVESETGQWAKSAFKYNNCWMMGVGSGQMIRGRVKGAYRPTFIIFDDIYDENNITDTQRKTIKKWFYGAAMNSLDTLTGKALLAGTILHFDTVLIECENSSMWKSAKFYPMPSLRFKDLKKHFKVNEATRTCMLPFDELPNEIIRTAKQIEYFNELQVKEDWGLAWPERHNLYYMATKYKDAVETSSIDTFYQEYFHEPINESRQRFKPEFFQRIKGEWEVTKEFGYTWFKCKELYSTPQIINIEFGVDLAGIGSEADNTVIQPLGALPDKRLIVFPPSFGKMGTRDIMRNDSANMFRYERILLDKQYIEQIGVLDETFRLALMYHPSVIKIGVAGTENKAPEDMRMLFEVNQLYIQVFPRPQSRAQGAKHERIKGTLLKRYETLSVFHCNGTDMLELELEKLTKFPTDDLADALECAAFNISFPAAVSYSQFTTPNFGRKRWRERDTILLPKDWRVN